jgi:16S rRNA (uracil1498-N3)-methyltransferase
MREPRIYVEQALQSGLTLALGQDASHHISRVLRMRVGQRIWLFNGLGGSYLAEISVIRKRQVDVILSMFNDEQQESNLQITLAQGISRAQHMDYTLQKAVELGVSRIVPVITEFSNVQFDPQRKEKKLLHWRKIIISACEQCGRNILPEILAPKPLTDWLQMDSNTLKLLLHPGAGQRLSALQNLDESLVLLSGPEGGFSPPEVEQIIASGYLSVALGPRVLRTETAAAAAISACQTLWGDMG